MLDLVHKGERDRSTYNHYVRSEPQGTGNKKRNRTEKTTKREQTKEKQDKKIENEQKRNKTELRKKRDKKENKDQNGKKQKPIPCSWSDFPFLTHIFTSC